VTEVTLVTSNPEKFREIRQIVRSYGISLHALARTLPEPQADSLEAVVAAKLEAVRDLPGWVAVEDSGIELNALHGFPGVYSAYAYRTIGLEGILRLLRGRSRTATFRTVAGLRRGARHWTFEGSVSGRIVPTLRGAGGFGYDPLFIPAGGDRTFAELPRAAKNRISHRSRAFTALGAHVRSLTEKK
jgi:XTP/dITP diphosphohydrolase